MKQLIVIIVVLLTGCTPMSYDEVKAAEKWCTDRNMVPVYSGWKAKGSNTVQDINSVGCEDSRGFRFNVGGK